MGEFDDFLTRLERQLEAHDGLARDDVLAQTDTLVAAGHRPNEDRLAEFFKRLRGARLFSLVTDMAQRLPDLSAPSVLQFWSQAEIDQGLLEQALVRLQALLPSARETGGKVLSETLGLIGRTHKDRFVRATSEGDRATAKDAMRHALISYADAYPLDPSWHGANLSALSWRAEYEMFGFPQTPDAVGRRLIEHLGDDEEDLASWDVSGLAQAHMARGNWVRGAALYGFYARRVGAGAGSQMAFRLYGDLRQLRDIWLAHQPGAQGHKAYLAVTQTLTSVGGSRGPTHSLQVAAAPMAVPAAPSAPSGMPAAPGAMASSAPPAAPAAPMAPTVAAAPSAPLPSPGTLADNQVLLEKVLALITQMGPAAAPERILQAVIAPGAFVSAALIDQLAKTDDNICRVRNRHSQTGGGTGFLIDPKVLGLPDGPGVMVTNEHVLTDDRAMTKQLLPEDAEAFFERWEGKRFRVGRILWSSHHDLHDIAIATLEALDPSHGTIDMTQRDNPFIRPSGDREPLGMVFPVGHPGGRSLSYSFGANDVLDHNLHLAGTGVRLLHYNANTEGGSSGSPVFDENGQVAAVHRAAVKQTIAGSPVDHPDDYVANEGVGVVAALRACRADLAAGVRAHAPG